MVPPVFSILMAYFILFGVTVLYTYYLHAKVLLYLRKNNRERYDYLLAKDFKRLDRIVRGLPRSIYYFVSDEDDDDDYIVRYRNKIIKVEKIMIVLLCLWIPFGLLTMIIFS